MRKALLGMVLLVNVVGGGIAAAQELPDLKVTKVEFVPYSETDTKPITTKDKKLQLHTFRSYRVIVTIQSGVRKGPDSSFVVRTVCVRDGKSMKLGEARVGSVGRGVILACYDIFPAEGEIGDCLVRTIADADNEIKKKSDKTPGSNTLELKGRIVR
jgi:hypothetical protein